MKSYVIYRAGTYFDADQKWRTKMHSGFIYEPQNLDLQHVEITHKKG